MLLWQIRINIEGVLRPQTKVPFAQKFLRALNLDRAVSDTRIQTINLSLKALDLLREGKVVGGVSHLKKVLGKPLLLIV